MVRGYLIALLLAAYPVLAPAPPGRVQQNITAYLTGEGMSSRWQVVTSKKLAGKMMGKTPVYQWTLSIYAPPDGDRARLAFRSPGLSDLVPAVQRAANAQMYFPLEDVKIAGTAQLERAAVDDVVVVTHAAGADCGTATVSIIGADPNGNVSVRHQLQNYCDLKAQIVHEGRRDAVRLTGAYYAHNSPVCCPAKPRVTAMLRYRNGQWIVTPRYFK
ncbi:MAG TPA: hypothetical protein VFL13_02675 [Candidatus Baltobacteraceae bacterium]|nr:hypothetical protein [Candidatus Baltobacteraceae bacterium]